MRLGLRGCGRTINLAEPEMLKQENPMNECAGEQVEKPIVTWIYSLSAYQDDTGKILKQLDERRDS